MDDPTPTPIPHFIPGWIQVRLRLSSFSGDIINTFSYQAPAAGTRYTGSQLASIASAFGAMALSRLQPMIAMNIRFVDVTVNDLGDALGEQGTYNYPSATFGTSAGETLPLNVAISGTFRTKYRGPKYRGRTFVGGFTEAATNGDSLTNTFATAISLWLGDVLTFTGPFGVTVQAVVASRKSQLLTRMTSVVLTTIVDTMKRRLATHGR